MISKIVLRLIGLRFSILQLGCCSQFGWDFRTNRLTLLGKYSQWNWIVFLGYMCMYFLLLSNKLWISFLNIKFELVEKGNDSSTLYSNDSVMEQILEAGDFAYITTICLIISAGWQHNRMRKDIVLWFNQIVSSDEALTEKYGDRLNYHPITKRYNYLLEIITIFTSTVSLLIAAVFPIVFLSGFDPLHRFFSETLEATPKFENKWIPILFFIFCAILQCCNTVFIWCVCGIIHSIKVSYWFTVTMPTDTTPILSVKGAIGKHTYKFLTPIGLLEIRDIFEVYKINKIHCCMCNKVTSSLLITVHHACLLFIFVCLSYVTVHFSSEAFPDLVYKLLLLEYY